jgi:tRNA(Ser,Leu) C12 N-acetylase TAN1
MCLFEHKNKILAHKFGRKEKNTYLCSNISPLKSIMETSDKSIELQIAEVLSDIRQKGYSSVQPFSIGKVEERIRPG